MGKTWSLQNVLMQTLVRETSYRKANFYFLEIRPLERTVHCWKSPMYCNFVHCIENKAEFIYGEIETQAVF